MLVYEIGSRVRGGEGRGEAGEGQWRRDAGPTATYHTHIVLLTLYTGSGFSKSE